jgi:ATP-dependent Clp protease ATP-binding subunit ClpA
MISSELEHYIKAATTYARAYVGPETTLVHLLFAVLDDQEVQTVLSTCKISYLDLRQEAVEAIAEHMAIAKSSNGNGGAQRGEGLSALCLFAVELAQQKAVAFGSRDAGVLDLVAAMLEVHDNGSFDFKARIVLTQAGLTVSSFAKARRSSNNSQPYLRIMGERPSIASFHVTPKSFPETTERQLSEVTVTGRSTGAGNQFCTDLTEEARLGKLDRSYGRNDVLDELRVILGRRKKRNAVLIGDPGVGKTSVVEELAYMIVEGRAGPTLEGTVILSLNMGALVGGTKYRGDLEERVKDLVAVISADPKIILFIDEIHVLASPAHSAAAAADILKPALASGAIRCIGATTLAEFKKFFESDGAMSRRFAPVNVIEPSRDEALGILESVAPSYAEFHKVAFPDWVLPFSLDLSIRHMPDRRLPDKAIELLDDIGARTALTRSAVVTRQIVTDCVSAKICRRVDRSEILAAIAALQSDEAAIARAALRNSLAAPIENGRYVIAVVGAGGTDSEVSVRRAAEALARGYEALNMAEFADHASASGLLGAPAGYVGYDSGGRLYDVVKRSPGGVLHLRNISQAHPSALAIIDECLRNGFVRDRTGRVAGLGGVQVIVSMTSENGRASIGFAAPKEDITPEGVAIVVQADTVITLLGATDDVAEFTRKEFLSLAAAATAAGARMMVSDGVEEHVSSMLMSFNSARSRTFSQLVRVPVLDYLVSGSEDFIVESSEGGVRVRKYEVV